jgi:1,4-dihydroxy-2-naphthoate polyprenyltransferase
MKVIYWIKAARLRTLPLAFSSIFMGASLSILKESNISLTILSLTLLTTLLLQILSNFANDYGDGIKGTDLNRKNQDRMVQSGHISKNQMLVAIITVSIFAFISGLILLLMAFNKNELLIISGFLILGIIAIISAIKYTVGKSAYGYKGFGDLFVFMFFGLVGVIGSFYLLTHSFHWLTIPGAIFTGFLSCAVLNTNNMRDFINDKKAGKNTIVVYLGISKSKIYHYSLIIGALIAYLTLLTYASQPLLWFSFLPLFFIIKNLYNVYKNEILSDLDNQLKLISLTCFFTCLAFLTLLFYLMPSLSSQAL